MKSAAKFLSLTLAIGLSNLTYALPDDRNQPVYIESDRAERNENKGITTYFGDVQIRQGSIKINAEQVILHNSGNKLSKIVASGGENDKRARLEQKPSIHEAPVIARGELITYRLNGEEEQITIENNATLKQTHRSFEGDRIDYDVTRAIVKAVGGEKIDGQPNSGRVKIVIPPVDTNKNNSEKSD